MTIRLPASTRPVAAAAAATVAYALVTTVLTWPLAVHATRSLPGDLGDPVLNAWILAWDATHLGPGLWNAPIYHPNPLALAYSEHLLSQAVFVLPLYAATRNAVLCYNVVFFATFVVSGLGMFLLMRELTGRVGISFVAGLAFAFAPYRFGTIPHVQVLSSCWMPFVFLGFRRYFETGRIPPLVGGAAAWVLQNLSCGYYLLFFSPVVLLYITMEILSRRRSRPADLLRVAIACASVAALTAPFLLPYVELRRLGFSPRSFAETRLYSADVFAYLTADSLLRVDGALMQFWPKAEGFLFPGFTITILSIAGTVAAWRAAREGMPAARVGVRALAWLVGASLAVSVAMLFGWRLRASVLKITNLSRTWLTAAVLSAMLLAISPRARRTFTHWLASPAGMLSVLAVFAATMSLGPQVQSRYDRLADSNLYSLFYAYVPGFDGVRAPARFGMVVAFCLAALAGLGLRALETARVSGAAVFAGALILIEAWAVPLPLDQPLGRYQQPGLSALPASLDEDQPTRELYAFVATLPPTSAILELPLGEPAFDVRYMLSSTRHWKPLVNGYSGGEPLAYGFLRQRLENAATDPDLAWQTIVETRATHVIVHESFYVDRGPATSAWVRERTGSEVASFGPHRVFRLR